MDCGLAPSKKFVFSSRKVGIDKQCAQSGYQKKRKGVRWFDIIGQLLQKWGLDLSFHNFSHVSKVLVTGVSSFQATCAFSEEKLTTFRVVLSTKDSLKWLIFPFRWCKADKSSDIGMWVYSLNCLGYEFWVLPLTRLFNIYFIKNKNSSLSSDFFYMLTPICGITFWAHWRYSSKF